MTVVIRLGVTCQLCAGDPLEISPSNELFQHMTAEHRRFMYVVVMGRVCCRCAHCPPGTGNVFTGRRQLDRHRRRAHGKTRGDVVDEPEAGDENDVDAVLAKVCPWKRRPSRQMLPHLPAYMWWRDGDSLNLCQRCALCAEQPVLPLDAALLLEHVRDEGARPTTRR